MEPLLKWPGGKRWIVKYILSIIPEKMLKSSTLVELFAGGAALSFKLETQNVVLNDINPHLINFYRQIAKGNNIFKTDIEFINDKKIYYKNRERFNNLIRENKANTLEAAALFYYLNKTGYNGLVRFNKSGLFNVPYGRHKTINYEFDTEKYKELMESWKFYSVDFSEVPLSNDSIVYADPPYDVEFTNYSADGFSWDDQVRLVEYLMELDVPIILSNQATERIIKLYKKSGFNFIFVEAPRYISCNGDRTKAKEIIAYKNFKLALERRGVLSQIQEIYSETPLLNI